MNHDSMSSTHYQSYRNLVLSTNYMLSPFTIFNLGDIYIQRERERYHEPWLIIMIVYCC